MRTYDISAPLRDRMAGFPGDPEVRITKVRSIGRGDPYELSALALGSHTGTHVDPPSHFVPGGLPVDQLDLSVLNGRCEVVDVPAGRSEVGLPEVRAVPQGAERVLFRTANSARWARSEAFFADYVAIGLPAAHELLDRKLRLVGIDSLSVEVSPDASFPVHRLLLGHGLVILEGLRLADVRAGPYELRCLPLRIHDGDGGPARAVLLER